VRTKAYNQKNPSKVENSAPNIPKIEIGSLWFAIIAERGGLCGRKAMEWFKQKTSIAGVQVSNWMIVLGAIIIVLLIVQNSH
jgi:hypothetical protein